MECIVSDANYTTDLILKPRNIDSVNNIYSRAYGSCNQFNLYVTNNKQNIKVYCLGDFACYLANIYAQNANNLNITALGQYSLYEGDIYTQNIQLFQLFCQSEFGEQV